MERDSPPRHNRSLRTAVIAHFARPSIVRSVESLLQSRLIDRVIVVTTDRARHLDDVRDRPGVAVVEVLSDHFCKATLLNEGLKRVDVGLVLVSDADIVWSARGLGELIEAVENADFDLVWLDTVTESEPERTVAAMQHRRLGFRVRHLSPGEARVELFEDLELQDHRPGYGILCGQRQAFERVGGYKTGWGGGWGWEDVDIILRAKLMGLKLGACGRAVHLTHDDELRALSGGSKITSRDRNIALSRRDIRQGRLLGALGDPDYISDLHIAWRNANDA